MLSILSVRGHRRLRHPHTFLCAPPPPSFVPPPPPAPAQCVHGGLARGMETAIPHESAVLCPPPPCTPMPRGFCIALDVTASDGVEGVQPHLMAQ